MFIKDNVSGIYKIICLSIGKIYIGSSINIRKRFREHKNELRKNKHYNPYLQKAWNKHKENNFKFEIIEIVNSNLLIQKELIWFKKTNCCNHKYGFNLAIDPSASFKGRKHSRKTKLKMSISGKGRIFTNEHKLNMSLSSKGKKKSKIHIENLKKAKKGKYKGSKNPNAKLIEKDIPKIRKMIKNGFTNIEIGKIFNISHRTISLIKLNQIWSHIK